MIRNARNAFLLTVMLGAVSACAYLSGQNQSCPPVSEVSDPSTVALPPAPKPPPKDEVVAGPAGSAPAVEPPPVVADVSDGGAQEGGATAVAQKADGGAAKPKPPVVATAGGGDAPACGDRANPCPMQKFMRGTMGSAKTPEELTAAFTRASALSPNGGWQWRSIAQKGAELAKGGDAAAAKKQCKACHDQYKEPYKQQYRARKI